MTAPEPDLPGTDFSRTRRALAEYDLWHAQMGPMLDHVRDANTVKAWTLAELVQANRVRLAYWEDLRAAGRARTQESCLATSLLIIYRAAAL